jgi:hypothetical protein
MTDAGYIEGFVPSVLPKISEGGVTIIVRLARQAEHALAEDVPLDLVGPAVDWWR